MNKLEEVQTVIDNITDAEWKGQNAKVTKKGSLRYNEGKPEMSQLSPEFLLELSQLMTEGAKKYGSYNWTKGQDYSMVYNSLQRHLLKFFAGEDIDPESGMPHTLHIAANAMILHHSFKHHKDLDDRPEEFKK